MREGYAIRNDKMNLQDQGLESLRDSEGTSFYWPHENTFSTWYHNNIDRLSSNESQREREGEREGGGREGGTLAYA